MLTLIATKSAGAEEVSKMVEYHNDGFLLGPSPSYTPQDTNEEPDFAQDALDLEK